MRRVLALACAAVLLLCGCSTQGDEKEAQLATLQAAVETVDGIVEVQVSNDQFGQVVLAVVADWNSTPQQVAQAARDAVAVYEDSELSYNALLLDVVLLPPGDRTDSRQFEWEHFSTTRIDRFVAATELWASHAQDERVSAHNGGIDAGERFGLVLEPHTDFDYAGSSAEAMQAELIAAVDAAGFTPIVGAVLVQARP